VRITDEPHPEHARKANDRIAETAARMRFVAGVPLVCECRDPNCTSVFQIALDAYRALRENPYAFLTAPGHHLEGATGEPQGHGSYTLQQRLR
jgi:hypothetical protein